MKIYIPTLGRERQATWDALPAVAQQHTLLVCDPSEVAFHKRKGRRAVGCPVQGDIGRVRQWIIERVLDAPILMLDDDLRFFTRVAPGDWHLKKSTEHGMLHMLRTTARMLRSGYAHVSCTFRSSIHALQSTTNYGILSIWIIGFFLGSDKLRPMWEALKRMAPTFVILASGAISKLKKLAMWH